MTIKVRSVGLVAIATASVLNWGGSASLQAAPPMLTAQVLMAQANGATYYNCLTREVWSPQKQEWCDRVAQLKNAEYQLVDMATVHLVDGRYENREEYTIANLIEREGSIVFADVDGGAEEEAIVLISANFGGSGTFVYLMVMSGDRYSGYRTVTSALLGDRVNVHSIGLNAEGDIQVNMLTQAENDPLCCPTLEVIRTYAFMPHEPSLLLIAEESVPVPLQ